jgi:hypothetical protein
MVLQGRIQNGVIVLDDAPTLPDGARVRVEILASRRPEAKGALRRLFGSVSVGPPNGAENDAIDADIARAVDDQP